LPPHQRISHLDSLNYEDNPRYKDRRPAFLSDELAGCSHTLSRPGGNAPLHLMCLICWDSLRHPNELDHAKVDPDHDPLRGDPRFKTMLAAAEARLSVDGPRSPQGSHSTVGKPIAPEKGRCAAVVTHEGRGPAIVDEAVALDPQGVVRR